MHPMGMLGPIDPTVGGPFNPPNPQNPTQFLGISVEDVASYISLVKNDVGIRHEEELVQAFALLARKVHPLALGNVKRATSQSRMMGEKLLKQRAEDLDEHELAEIIDKLTSQLYFHGHPINRQEAVHDLRLEFVEEADDALEAAMWALYEDYVADMDLDKEFQPLQDAYAQNQIQPPSPPQLLPNGQVVPSVPATNTVAIGPVKAVYVESGTRTDVREVSFEVTVRREWAGELNANIALVKQEWVEEP
jgi:hypothetical protein